MGEDLTREQIEALRQAVFGVSVVLEAHIFNTLCDMALRARAAEHEPKYMCDTCGTRDPSQYVRCDHPACPDGHDQRAEPPPAQDKTFWVLERKGKNGPEYWDGGHADQYGDIHHAVKFHDKTSPFFVVRPYIDKRFAGVDGEPPRLVEHAFMLEPPAQNADLQTGTFGLPAYLHSTAQDKLPEVVAQRLADAHAELMFTKRQITQWMACLNTAEWGEAEKRANAMLERLAAPGGRG